MTSRIKNMAGALAPELIVYAPWFNIAPSKASYEFKVDVDTSDSHVYDYKLDVTCDLNSMLNDFRIERVIQDPVNDIDDPINSIAVSGEAAAWAKLHTLLSTGAGDTNATFLTTMHDGNTTTSKSWDTFWSGLLSECIDDTDFNGMSVNMTSLKAVIDRAYNATPANDVTGSINDALGATITVGAVSTPNPWGTHVIGTDIDASKNFLVALAVFLEEKFGAFDGTEGALTGDPNLAPQSFALKTGTGFALRISCSITVGGITNTRYGRIKIQMD